MNISQLALGSFQFKLISLFYAAGFLWAAWAYYRAVQERNMDADFFVHHFWKWVIGGLIGGRVFALLFMSEAGTVDGWLSIFAFWDAGFSGIGILLGFVGAMWFDLRHLGRRFGLWADLLPFAMLLLLLVADLGHTLTGTLHGTPTGLPWGISYNTFGVSYISPLHPVGLYAFILHFGLLRFVQSKTNPFRSQEGKLFWTFLGYFGVVHAVLGFVVGNPSLGLWGVSASQVLWAAVGAGSLWYAKKEYATAA